MKRLAEMMVMDRLRLIYKSGQPGLPVMVFDGPAGLTEGVDYAVMIDGCIQLKSPPCHGLHAVTDAPGLSRPA